MFFRRSGSSLSRVFILSSFFGALLIASAFAYFNYKFSQYNVIDFGYLLFYTHDDIFVPQEEEYRVILFSSKQPDTLNAVKNLKDELPVLAIDMYQERFASENGVIFVSAGMSTLVKFVQRFNVYEVPSIFSIEKFRDKQYKQNSPVVPLVIKE